MDGIQMEPIGKYKADRNGSAKATAWRNMVDQDLDDVAFLGDSEKAREAHDRSAPVAVCSQRRAICLVVLVFSTMFGTALVIVYAIPQPDCPCAPEEMLVPGSVAPGSDASGAAANKERIATNGATFPWRGARLPPYVVPKHYSLWLHPNLTTGELRGEVSIDFKVDRDTMFVVLNVRDMNVTERALFKSGGILGPKIVKTLEYPPAEQTYIEFKDKLRRKYNYTLSLRFITKLDRSDKQRGFFLAGSHRHRCAVSRFWLTHARSAFPCFDEPHFRAPFKFTIVRDRFHVSLTNMPIVATEEAGFYLGHRLLQDEFVESPPMAPHMISVTVCRLQRRAAPPLPTESTPTTSEPTPKPPTPKLPTHRPPTSVSHVVPKTTGSSIESTSEGYVEDIELPPPELSLYSDQQVILDDSAPFLEWVQKTIQQFAFELNTSYPLPKLDIVVLEGGSQYSEGWGLISLAPSTLSDTKTIARLLAQQWFGGLVSPRWWTSQWLMEALTSVIGQKAPPFEEIGAEKPEDTLLLEHVLPALRLDASNSVRAVASPRLERADIEAATDELSLHKGAAIVSMAIEAAGESRGRIALSSLLRDHRSASADARDLWLALDAPGTWDQWSERPGYPLVTASVHGPDVHLHQQRFLMTADPPSEEEPAMLNNLLTMELRADLDEIFYEPDNFTEPIDEDVNATTTTPMPTTTKRAARTTKPPPVPKWVIPITFIVGPLDPELRDTAGNSSSGPDKHATDHGNHWYDIGNETKTNGSRWAENVTHLVWMNDTDMVIPDLGRHKWVRYNVGARGLYRVAPQDPAVGESLESAAQRSSAQYTGGAPAERALILDDAFVLSRAGTLPASRALAAAARLSSERHWAPWRVVLSHMSLWRQLLRLTAAGPPLVDYLKTLHPIVTLYQHKDIASGVLNEDQLWLSGALLSAGVEWENPVVTRQAVDLFDTWFKNNHTIADLYQQAAFTAGIRTYGRPAWSATWKALMASYAAPKPLYNHKSLLYALASAKEDWLFYRFARTSLTNVPPRERRTWLSAVWSGACSWRGTSAVGALLADAGIVGGALPSAAACLYESRYYYQIKSMFPEARGLQNALDTIALNAAWVAKAEPDLVRYFNTMQSKN